MLQNEKNSGGKKKPLLLFSPLDWGLGHTTRCIPLLRQFLDLNFKIIVACNSTQKLVLADELPQLEFRPLEGYDVKYTQNPRHFRIKIGLQLGNILTKVKAENHWVADFVARNPVELIVSDNRYGFYHSKIPSVFITHQLRPKTGFPSPVNRIVQRSLYRFVNRFNECWIPDSASSNNLSGELSHTRTPPQSPLYFIGPLSRFQRLTDVQPKKFVLIVLSGPEPQRSIFENMLLQQFDTINRKIVIIRGLPGATTFPMHLPHVEVYNHLPSAKMNTLAQAAQFIVCRSGYTSIMDMISLRKKMIVVPTPGQSEQEYLAEYLSTKNVLLNFSQHQFNLSQALAAAEDFSFAIPELSFDAHQQIVRERTRVLCKSCFTDPLNSSPPSR